MYVCVCNALTDRQVTAAKAAGAKGPAKVFAAHGCRPQCGRCVTHMRSMLGQPAPAAGGAETHSHGTGA